MRFPSISVVIPTFDRAIFLPALFESLSGAIENYHGKTEILVIDDSSPEQAALTQEICKKKGAIYLRGSESVRKKRNLGIEQAMGNIILFVDSDCKVTNEIFDRHAEEYINEDPTIGGVVGVTRFTGKANWFWGVVERSQFLNAFNFADRMEFAPWATCTNTSYRRSVLLELNGFEVNFPFRLGADDTDLGLRLNKAGYKIKCNPRAVVFHTRETWSNFFAVAGRAFRWGRMDLHLYYRRHTERLYVGTPKFLHIFFAMTILALISTFLLFSLVPLLVPFIWAVLTLLIQAAGTVVKAGESWKFYPVELLADVLGLIFEFGTLIEGVKNIELAVFYKAVRRGPVLPAFEQSEWITQRWSMWLSVLLTIPIYYLLAKVIG